MSWKPLGAVLPQSLTDARLELHWATQLVSAVGAGLLPEAPDNSHANLGWVEALGVLAGRPAGGRDLRAALVFESLEIVTLEEEQERSSFPLAGRSLAEGYTWLALEFDIDREVLHLPEYDMPPHRVSEGGVFCDGYLDDRLELAAWFSDATGLIGDLVQGRDSASPVRCWPHHFDVASLLAFDPGAGVDEGRTIGVGFSPGDNSYDQPYFYVTPWPYPNHDRLPELEGGTTWHTEGWTGVVLTGDAVVSLSHDEQEAELRAVMFSAITACAGLLGV